jgi:hypothetical protein
MGKNKKFVIIITEEKNGRSETSKIYADSVTDAMNYIALINSKKASIKIIDGRENLIHSEIFGEKKEHKKDKDRDDKKDKDRDKDRDEKKDKDKENNGRGRGHDKEYGNGHLYHHGNGHWSHEEPRDDDDDDYMYA